MNKSLKWLFFIGGILLVSPIFLISPVSPIPPSDSIDNQPRVSRVIDGDTIELENGEKVRYIGIDTPETLDPRKPVQCFGKNAAAKNKELVEGKPVWLVKDISDKDKYGRLLRYVYLGDPAQESSVFVNLELVKLGFAHSSSYPPDIKYQNLFIEAEREARQAELGLWSSCPAERDPALQDPVSSLPPDSPNPPNLPDIPNLTPSSGCLIKANISSTGEKVYHLPGCGSYDKTKIDESRGEKWFCGEEEAVSAGWRKAKNC
ncbi:thermonuclease family protein [Candidatus Collierbacteria bacterium]|nr:thermonuclease family protein [Candidatus Collierbacteria bacterium]